MLCRLWQQGSCHFGDRCKFVHPGPPGSGEPAQGGKGDVCHRFLRGTCRFGENCRYLHPANGGGQGGGRGKGWSRAAGQGFGKGGGFESKGSGIGKGPGQDLRALTGPYLGRGSELAKVWWMSDHMGHTDGIYASIVMGDRVCTGGRDGRLLLWRGGTSPQSGNLCFVEDNAVDLPAGVSSLLYHAESKWLFCGLMNGLIKAFRQEPHAEAMLTGHGEAVTSMLVHESVLLSGSHDGTIRAWQYDPASSGFRCAATVACPLGEVFKLHLQLPTGLWVGAQRGISCVDLQTMQPKGNIEAPARVVGLLSYQECVIAAFANGVVKVFDAVGKEQFSHGPLGEHTTNTAIAMMRVPRDGKDVLLCAQEFGYVTVYDVPDFNPRGTFTTGYDGEVMAIVDMGSGGIFVTCGLSGDVVIWRWEEDGNMATSGGMF